MKVVVVGSGIDGLATTCRFAGKAYDAPVFERNVSPGAIPIAKIIANETPA
ncbi:hypothetical protein [Aquimarina sp. RZ0]|uniref:hypothetical protein n=1 Tax=Aquimarina sp. RZ0 TaxID=2607730 RepID=UPI00165EDDA5|nr:hypothetical protein [Aquimarina sp. RZ0]